MRDEYMEDDDRLDDAMRLDAYLAGELRGEELRRVEAWLDVVPERRVTVDRIVASMAGLDSVSIPSAHEIVSPIRETIASRGRRESLATSPVETRGRPAHGSGVWRRAWVMSVVGALAAALVIVAVPHVRAVFSPSLDSTLHDYRAASAQRLAVTLPDSSRVVLAPETELRYTTDRSGARIAELVGEAFFTVVPRAEAPFVVRTGAVTTRVLGTAFNVRHYAAEHVTQIAVVSGRVAAAGRSTPVVLAAGTVAYATDSTVTVNLAGDAIGASDWTRGRLVFNDTPVSAMLATLGRWYGYEFHLSDSTMAAQHVSLVLDTDQPAYAMNTLKAVLNVTMTFDGKVVTLRPEHGNGSTAKGKRNRELLNTTDLEVGR